MCTGTSYDNNNVSFIHTGYQQQVVSDILAGGSRSSAGKLATEHHMFRTVATAVGQ